jgi:hypothetical protein
MLPDRLRMVIEIDLYRHPTVNQLFSSMNIPFYRIPIRNSKAASNDIRLDESLEK